MMAAGLLLTPPTIAVAAEAPREISMDGVALRLVAEAPSETGEIRAALLVDLEPGWKTYWLDPGDAGIPPHLDLSGSRNLAPAGIGFPLPHRASDAYGMSNVYSQPFAVALTLHRPSPADGPSRIDLHASLGICREICIPLAAHLGLDIAEPKPADARLVAYAFDALPEPSTAEAGIAAARLSEDGQTIEVEAIAPNGRPVAGGDLFLAGPPGWFFGAPKTPKQENRRLLFSVPVTARPKSAGTAPPPAVEAVLTLGTRVFHAQTLPVAEMP